jgi:hypothetical protein
MRIPNRCLLAFVPLVFVAVPERATAGLIPAAVTVTPDGSNFRYQYQILLPSNYKLQAGDFFTIYDFHGYVAAPIAQLPGWTFSTSMLGPNPPHILPTDSPTVINLTWTYHGPNIVGFANIGDFAADSTFGPHMIDTDFASQDHNAAGGQTVGNITFTSAPDPNLPGAPEPDSLAIFAAGLPLVGLAIRSRRRIG